MTVADILYACWHDTPGIAVVLAWSAGVICGFLLGAFFRGASDE